RARRQHGRGAGRGADPPAGSHRLGRAGSPGGRPAAGGRRRRHGHPLTCRWRPEVNRGPDRPSGPLFLGSRPPKIAPKPQISGFFAFTGRFVASYISQDRGESGAGLPGAQRKRSQRVNKNDLIQKLADTTGLAKNDAAKAVDGVFDLIAATLKAGEEVRLTGFGVFVVATRAGGKGRNPQTGEEITIKPSRQPRFRAGKQLKDSLN